LKIENIHDHFKKLNFDVTIERLNRESFVVIFQSPVKAMRAFKYQCQMGYKLYFFKEMELSTRHSQMHATNCPSPDKMICDELFKGQFPDTTDIGEIVTINKSKGHRTTVVHRRSDFCQSEALG